MFYVMIAVVVACFTYVMLNYLFADVLFLTPLEKKKRFFSKTTCCSEERKEHCYHENWLKHTGVGVTSFYSTFPRGCFHWDLDCCFCGTNFCFEVYYDDYNKEHGKHLEGHK